MSQPIRYSMHIEWSDLDSAYIVSLPEWERAGHLAHTHGATYAEAAQKGEDLLAFLIGTMKNEAPPEPARFDDHAYAPGETAESIAADTQRLLDELDTSGMRTSA